MSDNASAAPNSQQWARFRFSIVGPLLAAPPNKGELGPELDRLAAKSWVHPLTGQRTMLGRSTIERWYYQALRERRDPVRALARKVRSDRGTRRTATTALIEALRAQHRAHPGWSYQLHFDNLAVAVEQHPDVGPMPSYSTFVRLARGHGLFKRKRLGPAKSPGARQAADRLEQREVRSYESPYVNALWHLDFHHGSVRVLMPNGTWLYPILFGVLDDHSRLCCHVQWYLSESAENLIHGLSQAILKRGLPRSLMSDNGSAMKAAETTQGLERLGVVHELTLPYSPYQNGKQESFWGQVEGRLLAMLDGVGDMTLAKLNEATTAWAEIEYNRSSHSSLPGTPIHAFANDKDVGRPSPSAEQLALAFTERLTRTQRRSDGTVTVNAKRFEVPSRYGHMNRLKLRAASWDLSRLHLCDPATEQVIARLYPLDKARNADARRRTRPNTPLGQSPVQSTPGDVAPLMRKIIAQYAATGLPPAYLPKDERID